MKRYILTVVVLLFILTISLNAEKYPKNTLVELIANSSHGCATQAANGLAVVRDNFHAGELSIVRYYTYPEGSYGNEETQARINWMEPTDNVACYFNGGNNEDGGEGAGTGARYLPHCEAKNIEFSPITIHVTPIDIDGTSGSFQANIECGEAFNEFGKVITAVVVEDGLSSIITNVTRTIPETRILSVNAPGDTQEEDFTFDIDSGWEASNLYAVVFVQDIATKEVIQSGNNYDAPGFYHRVCAEELSASVEQGENHEYDDFYLYTFSPATDTYQVTMTTDYPGTGWWGMFCDDAACYPSQASFDLDGGTVKHFHVTIAAGTAEEGSSEIAVSSATSGISKILNYSLSALSINNKSSLYKDNASYLSCYPNPFNPETTIEYSLPEGTQNGYIEIYNTKGMLIKSIAISSNTGSGQFVWDGTNARGEHVSSGFYFYNLKSDGKTLETKKMLLLK